MRILGMNPRAIYSVAKKEFADNLRNKWVIALTVIFIILTLATSYLAGAGGPSALGGMEETVVMLMGIVVILIPIIAIMLGYATISGECENGSLAIVLAYPVKRTDVLLGKIVGLTSVIAVSTVLGFGIGGVLIALSVGAESWAAYLAFVAFTILLGILYLSVAVLFSTLAKRRVTSLAGGVVLFFWSMIYGTIIFGIFIATGGNMHDILSGNVVFPDWLWASLVFSPGDMCQMAVMLSFGIDSVLGFSMEVPSFMNLWVIVAAQLVWISVSLVLAFYFFKRRDI